MKRKLLYSLISILFFSHFAFSQGCLRITGVDPATNVIVITNTTGATVDISDYRLCSLFSYTTSGIAANTSVISGNPSAVPNDDFIVLLWNLNDIAADLSMYLPTGAFSDPNSMVDFMQYGSSGNGREPEAVAAGLWTAGEFVPGANSMVWAGLCTDHSASNWFTTGIGEIQKPEFQIGPNPVQDILTINSSNFKNQSLSIKVFNVIGSLIESVEFSSGFSESIDIGTENWQAGVYFVQLVSNGEIFHTEKVLKNK